ncbi:MAG TPA: outer membrane protein transport protein [Candidatus Sulfotelmatobacter sp.]|jgi:long-chain fatty acid transport protein|nr:outer membrane protein transport protein [Candidatus Sulfotelmatobacter sp.]
MKWVFQICLLACWYGALQPAVFANGLSVPSQDSFAAARGNAFAATADNASAIYYNPAGLTQIAGTELRGGIYGIYLDPTFTPPASAPNHDDTYRIGKHYSFVPQLYLAHSFTNMPLSIGLGVFAPFGGSLSWPNDTGFRTVATKGTTTYLRINPVVAGKFFNQLSIGAGLSANYARMNLEQGLRPLAEPLENDFRFTGDGWALGANAGLLWQPCDYFSFGASFRDQTAFSLSGETAIEQQPIISSTSIPARMDIKFPLDATLGFSIRPTPKWNLEFDATYTDWNSFGNVTIRQSGSPPFPVQQNIPVKLEWQSSWMYEAGVTRYFDHGWHASAGYVFDENSVPNNYYTPLAADLDRQFFSVGIGRTGKTFDFDVTYQFGYGPAHTVTGSSPASTPGLFAGQNANGTYNFISQAIFVSAGVHF